MCEKSKGISFNTWSRFHGLMKPYLLVGIFKFSSPKALFLSSWKSFQDAYTVLSAELLWLHNRIILFHWGKLAFFISWYFFPLLGASLVVQMVKNLPAMQESWVQSLGRKEPLEKGMATHSSILAWEIPWTEEPGGLQSRGSQRVGHDWENDTHTAGSLEESKFH